MSLAIDVDAVSDVLLADGWHAVANSSFTLDSYEFLWYSTDEAKRTDDPMLLHGGGNSGVCATGFSFTDEDGSVVSGPLTAVLAVKTYGGD